MTTRDHHLLCLGLLALIYQRSRDYCNSTELCWDDARAIEEAVRSAEALGLPVSAEKLIAGQPIAKETI